MRLPVFGTDRDPLVVQRLTEAGQRAQVRREGGRVRYPNAHALRENPMPVAYGPGPADKRCGDCQFLIAHVYAKTYYKCAKRSTSSSVTSDHRVRWPTCGLFEPAKEGD